MKPGSIQPPKLYFGANIGKTELPNGIFAWGICTSKYIQDSVKTTEHKLEDMGMQLSVKTNPPISKDYWNIATKGVHWHKVVDQIGGPSHSNKTGLTKIKIPLW